MGETLLLIALLEQATVWRAGHSERHIEMGWNIREEGK